MAAEAYFRSDLDQRLGTHQCGVAARQLALTLMREAAQEQVGHGQ